MIAMLFAALAVVGPPRGLIEPSCPTSPAADWLVCQEVALAARAAGVPARLAVTLAWSESRFQVGAVSPVGAQGPLQVLPRYWCPGGRAEGCDLTMAGTMALRQLFDAHGLERGLCHYASGNVCTQQALKYARFVIGRAAL